MSQDTPIRAALPRPNRRGFLLQVAAVANPVDNDSVEGFAFLRVSTTLAPLSPAGNRYGVTVCARWREGKSDGAITLQRLANDSATFVPVLTAIA